jgi:hypothetical protein
MATNGWKQELKKWDAPKGKRKAREVTVAILGGRDEKHVKVVMIGSFGDFRSLEIPRADVPELAKELASGFLGRVDLVGLGVVPREPPPPPPGPIGDEAIYAAKLNVLGAINTLVELAELRAVRG